MSKIKILFLIHDLGGGGAENVLVNLVNNMDIEKFDITVESIFGGGVNEKRLSPNIRYTSFFKHSIPANCAIFRLFSPTQLHGFFIKDKYDIEVAYTESVPTRIISGCSDKNTKLHAWIHCTLKSAKTIGASFRSIKEIEKSYIKFDYIHCVSESVKDSFLQHYPENKNIDVLYNSIDSEKIFQKKNELVKEKIFYDKEIRICAVGKLTKLKGFDRLINIHKALKEKGYQIHTYVLGDGEEKNNLECLIKENGLGNSFSLLGYLTNPYKYMAKCDIFVCSSYSEGFSTATTEALIIGNAICTVEVSGMKELLGENNEYGIITKNEDIALLEGLEKLVRNQQLLNHYKKQALIRGAKFNTKETVKMVEESLLK